MGFGAIQRMTFFQLDCGIHPGLSGMDALPFVDLVEADEIDLLLISQ
jgi:Cft2 family RNA processing exonuclease